MVSKIGGKVDARVHAEDGYKVTVVEAEEDPNLQYGRYC